MIKILAVFSAAMALAACQTTQSSIQGFKAHNAGKPWSATVSEDVFYSAPNSIRLEYRPGDLARDPGSNPPRYVARSELTMANKDKATHGSSRYYSWAFNYDPSTDWSEVKMITGQIHALLGKGEMPILSHQTKPNNIITVVWHKPIKDYSAVAGTADLTIIPGNWYRVTYEVKYTFKDDGYVRGWINGKQFIDYNGPFGARNGRHVLKIGFYNQTQWSSVKVTEVAYFDDIKLGRGLAPDELKQPRK